MMLVDFIYCTKLELYSSFDLLCAYVNHIHSKYDGSKWDDDSCQMIFTRRHNFPQVSFGVTFEPIPDKTSTLFS